ncbi:hypothetical protein EDD21DRAFT_419905 [Dissophora ornata]|nr:hypothetical protein EDD21DRAFT_419905 [Dissophora ornata]
MFASSGMFTVIPCPSQPACPREAFCNFSHAQLPPTEATSFTTSSTSATTPTRKIKRKLGDITAEDDASRELAQRCVRKTDKHCQNTNGMQPTVQRYRTPISAMESAKARREALNTIPPHNVSCFGSEGHQHCCASIQATVCYKISEQGDDPTMENSEIQVATISLILCIDIR